MPWQSQNTESDWQNVFTLHFSGAIGQENLRILGTPMFWIWRTKKANPGLLRNYYNRSGILREGGRRKKNSDKHDCSGPRILTLPQLDTPSQGKQSVV